MIKPTNPGSNLTLSHNSLGPGTVGFGGESQSFFMVSAALCLALILCHTAWGVVTFHGYDERKYHYVAFVWAAHYLFSCLVSSASLSKEICNNRYQYE